MSKRRDGAAEAPEPRPATRLILELPREIPAADLLLELVNGADVAAVLHRPAVSAPPSPSDLTAVQLVQEASAAWLLDGPPGLIRAWGADGCHMTASVESRPRELAELRRQAAGASLGFHCGISRHAGLLAAEAEADYVAFSGEDPELLEWWQATMTLPCVAMGGVTLETAAALSEAGADFLVPPPELWDSPLDRLLAYQAAIAPESAT